MPPAIGDQIVTFRCTMGSDCVCGQGDEGDDGRIRIIPAEACSQINPTRYHGLCLNCFEMQKRDEELAAELAEVD